MLFELKPGAIIDVVATSSGDINISIEQIKNFIASLGYVARVPSDLQKEGADLFSANTDDIRYKNFASALTAQDSDAIWIFRGGYGATRLIPMLDKHDFSGKEKTIIGFSDVTALGIYFTQKYNWKFIHGRMVSSHIAKNYPEELAIMEQIFSGDWKEIKYDLTPLNQAAKESASISSKITGGNISLIECSLGTNWQIKTHNKILLIEEVGERGYRLDRSLQHMSQAGCFNEIDALLIGDVSCAPEKDGSLLCEPALSRFITSLDVPVFQSLKFGHGQESYPLLLNYEAHITMGDEPRLFFKNTD